MSMRPFIVVGENIHCTRIYKVDGKFVRKGPDGVYRIHFSSDGSPATLRVPDAFIGSADWEAGRVKHCAVAIWQANHGNGDDRAAGIAYLQALAREQEAAGAAYLDINIDEYSTDLDERIALIGWVVEQVQHAVSIPMSIDSSNTDILRAGLKACDPTRGCPMINSVSLERTDAIAIAGENRAVVIASAAGESGLPNAVDERMANFARLMPMLRDAGLDDASVHADPLVFPISTDGSNGTRFLETVKALRDVYGPAIHIVAGLSNVSFGMPNRKLINQTFARLAYDAGADGGIVDPAQINLDILKALDTDGRPYRMAQALLLGEDEYGMAFITANREGTL